MHLSIPIALFPSYGRLKTAVPTSLRSVRQLNTSALRIPIAASLRTARYTAFKLTTGQPLNGSLLRITIAGSSSDPVFLGNSATVITYAKSHVQRVDNITSIPVLRFCGCLSASTVLHTVRLYAACLQLRATDPAVKSLPKPLVRACCNVSITATGWTRLQRALE